MKNKEDSTFKRLMGYAGKRKALTYTAVILSAASSVLAVCPFLCIFFVIREVLYAIPDISQAENLRFYGWLAFGSAAASMLVYFAALMCSHLSAFRVASNMKKAAIEKLIDLPLGYFNQNTSGKLRRIIEDSTGLTEAYLAHQLPDIAGALATPVTVIVLMLFFDWRLGLVSLIPIAIGLAALNTMVGKDMEKDVFEYQNVLEDVNSEAVEYVRGIPVVKTFQQSVFSFKNFHDAIMRYKRYAVNYTLHMRMPMCKYTVAINSGFLFLIAAGLLILSNTGDYIGFLTDFIFYILFTALCVTMMNKIMWTSENKAMAKNALNRLDLILKSEPLPEKATAFRPKDSRIEFRNVTFTYPNAKTAVLNNISFTVEPGSTVALVGPSGGGKSTIASLTARFWDAESGSVLIGGIDVRDMREEELMKNISFVFQDSRLFKLSVKDNIKAARPDATDEEVMRAVKAARCEDIINKLPKGIDTVVGTKGIYLSGGEAQRISLARAILKDAPIILLDEASAFADPENEYLIQKAMENLIKGKTVLMIAHRLSTVRDADNIIVIANGRAAEQGRHEELMAENGIYADMYREYEKAVKWRVAKEAAV